MNDQAVHDHNADDNTAETPRTVLNQYEHQPWNIQGW
jgi:hypothetical protein